MANIKTTFLGLELSSPIIVGSSELNNSTERLKKHEAAGAGAIVLRSLFEEQILMDIDADRLNNMYDSYQYVEAQIGYYLKKNTIDTYLKFIKEAKQAVKIPVIASINCVSDSEWINFSKQIEEQGADALEINMFIMPANVEMTGEAIEKMYIEIAEKITQVISIPVVLKIGTYFTGMANFIQKLSKTPISGLVLFNKFYSPAVDIEKERLVTAPIFSKTEDNANTLRWIGILSGKVDCDLVASTGIHSAQDVISNLLVGAQAVQMVSSIYKNGDEHISNVLEELKQWMNKKNYKTIDDFRGKLSQKAIKNPMLFERAQFMKYFADSGL
jgi:dihydroorotate dehydrogenase (fumarate)